MRARSIAGFLVCILLAAHPAQAKSSHRTAYATVIPIVGGLSLACIAASIALRFRAPDVDTLMAYKRYDSASTGLGIAGGVLAVPSIIFSVVGGLTLDLGNDEGRNRTSLWVVPTGNGLALGGTF